LGRRRNAVFAILARRAGRSWRTRWSSRSNGSWIALVAFVSLWARAASQSDAQSQTCGDGMIFHKWTPIRTDIRTAAPLNSSSTPAVLARGC
jgi:hypothetical protein